MLQYLKVDDSESGVKPFKEDAAAAAVSLSLH
jgi:hypothetical protein